MFEVLRGDPHEVVIRVAGAFDDRSGAQLARCIEELPEGDRVVVDFTRLSPFQPLDVGAVARSLAGAPSVSIRGLDRHHLRLLQYCGVHVPAVRPPAGDREG